MKKMLLFIISLFFLWFTFATVGWPTIIGDIQYDQNTNAIRYSKTFYDGLGWSEIHQYLLTTQTDQLITELGDLEFQENRLMSDLKSFSTYLQTQWFVPLKEFSLNKLPIKITLTLNHLNQIKDNESFQIIQVPPYQFIDNPENYMMSGYINSFGWSNKIYLQENLVSEISLSTCRLDPINFRWFWLENLDTILVIASSAKKDCWEGWYLWEDVHIINWIAPEANYFLAQNSQILDTYNYVPNRELKPTPWWLYIQPLMQWDNMVQGAIEKQEVEKIWLWERLKEWINKILGL